MSDYLFMLENHLSTDQNRVVAEVQTAASLANFSLFLTGGAMRDMLVPGFVLVAIAWLAFNLTAVYYWPLIGLGVGR